MRAQGPVRIEKDWQDFIVEFAATVAMDELQALEIFWAYINRALELPEPGMDPSATGVALRRSAAADSRTATFFTRWRSRRGARGAER